jgi:hypothetical protein
VSLLSRGWQRIAARYLTRLLGTPPADRVAFRWSAAHWLRHRDVLRDMAQGAVKLQADRLAGEHPLLATLELYAKKQSPSAIATLLMRIVFEHHLRGTQPSSAVLATAEILRGILRGHRTIERAIGGAATVDELLSAMAALQEAAGEAEALTGHGDFDQLWRTDLQRLCEHLLVPLPLLDDDEDEEEAGQPLDRSDAREADGRAVDPLLAEAPVSKTKGIGPNDPLPDARDRKIVADVRYLDSQSRGEVFRDPEHILPSSIARAIWLGSIAHARRNIDAGEVGAAEGQIGLLLSLEAGVSEGEVRRLGFGTSATPELLALDLQGQAIRRAEVRPPDAWEPEAEDSAAWLPTGGDVVFPLSCELVSLVTDLLAIRPGASSLLISEAKPTSERLIRRALNSVMPGSLLPVSAFRWRIAAELTQLHGLDAAQLAFGDEFGSSGAGTYYGRHPVAAIAQTVWAASRRITGAEAPLPAGFNVPVHAIGSRACLVDPTPLQRVAHLVERKRGRPNEADLPLVWRRLADQLAMHLLLATAHRPNSALGRIALRDFAPANCLVVLADKESDPAHMTRVACTGATFIAALANYLAFLETMGRRITPAGVAQVVRSILDGDAPLFRSVAVDGSVVDLDVTALIRKLPEPWQTKPNLQRHLLNQALIAAGVDPELRYFQLGWMTGQSHATSGCSPYSPADACGWLAEPLDEALRKLGWAPRLGPVSVEDVGIAPPLLDWSDLAERHASEHARRVREIRASLAESREEARAFVERAFVRLIPQEMPGFEYVRAESRSKQRIRPVSEHAPGVIYRPQVEAVLEPFASSPFKPIHRHVATAELARLLTQGIQSQRFRAYVPPVQKLMLSSEPSPFPKGAAVSLRQADVIRQGTIKLAGSFDTAKGTATDLASIAWLAVMSMSRYRDTDVALKLVNNAGRASASAAHPARLRVPLDEGHAFVSGGAGLAILRWANSNRNDPAPALDRTTLAAFLRAKLVTLYPPGCNGDPIERIEQTLRMAARFELTGISRTSMLLDARQATVTARRVASAEDGHSVREALPSPLPEQGDDPVVEGDAPARANPRNRPTGKHATPDIVRYLSREFAGEIDGNPVKPGEQRRAQIIAATVTRLDAAGSRLSVDSALLLYALHLLQEGGPRSTSGLKLNSIHTMMGRIARPLLAGDPGGDMRQYDSVRMTSLLLLVVLRAPRRVRARVLSELRHLHQYLASTHGIEPPEWSVLYGHAGVRDDGVDPGMVGDHEMTLVFSVLVNDLQRAASNGGTAPAQLRLHECHLAAALLAEASSGRPATLHGLTLADVHCSAAGDYLHFHASGKYGSLKTATSSGFIPLCGDFWLAHRDWFVSWLEARQDSAPGPLHETPLFQIPQADLGQRYRLADIFGRLGELLRWATRQDSARSYWIRKRGIQRRQRDVRNSDFPTARDAYRAMRESGHVLIDTELRAYLCDPSTFDDGGLSTLGEPARGWLAALSGMREKRLDRRWESSGRISALPFQTRLGVTYEAMAPPIEGKDAEDRTEAPRFVLPSRSRGIVWVGEVLAGICGNRPLEWIVGRTGATEWQVDRAREALAQLSVRTGLGIGVPSGLAPSRATPAALRMSELLKQWPQDLVLLSVEWASLARQVGGDAGIPLLERGYGELLAGLLLPLGFATTTTGEGNLPTYLPTEIDGSEAYGLWPALRWVLAVAWVARKIGLEPRVA